MLKVYEYLLLFATVKLLISAISNFRGLMKLVYWRILILAIMILLL